MSSTSHDFRRIFAIATTGLMVFLASFFIFVSPSVTYAQFSNSMIAKTYLIFEGTAESGNLISFDRTTQTFHLTQEISDPNLFGVVATNPAIVFRTSPEGVPIITSGEVYVQVTTMNGPISAGDYITSSPIPGRGQKADHSASFVVGIALDSFPSVPADTPTEMNMSTVDEGSIRVLLAIGPKPVSAEGSFGTDGATGGSSPNVNILGVPTPLATVIEYILAILVVVGSIYIAFRNFGSNMRESIISVGRNPLAKSSIQSMVVLNTVLIVLITMAGLFIGLMILFVEL